MYDPQDEHFTHHGCGCVEYSIFGASDPASFDPSCETHGVCTCVTVMDPRCPMHGGDEVPC